VLRSEDVDREDYLEVAACGNLTYNWVVSIAACLFF
jgi:hypothetical protein